MANINIRIDDKFKKEADELYGDLGWTYQGQLKYF